ncbi:hypothetical protein E6O75_ATG10557 [Venturia nashicola]|uniref:Uncharacterized protein n=1 Tax=Venturia nashicola TaxID=86259 RepID=A0A4Z1NWR1_9PEZI|nr:hypothetical protein E6O75_ATG10557 [Venturia nashicola]
MSNHRSLMLHSLEHWPSCSRNQDLEQKPRPGAETNDFNPSAFVQPGPAIQNTVEWTILRLADIAHTSRLVPDKFHVVFYQIKGYN